MQQQQQQLGCLILTDYAAFASIVSLAAGHQVLTGLHVEMAPSSVSPFVIQQPFMQHDGQSIIPAMQKLPMQSEPLHQAASKMFPNLFKPTAAWPALTPMLTSAGATRSPKAMLVQPVGALALYLM